MKKLKHIIVIFLVFTIYACDEDMLDETPLDFYSPENSFTTPEDIESALFYNYARMRDQNDGYRVTRYYLHSGTDLMYSSRSPSEDLLGNYINLTPTSGVASELWNRMFRMIFDANVVLSRIEKVNYPDPLLKTLHIAEAKFFRGYAYRLLGAYYGGVPIVLEEVTSPRRDFVRATKEETIAQAISDMKFAADNLPSVVNVAAPGRVNNAAANHFLAELYISSGENQKSIAAATKVINDPNISLMTSRFGRKSEEVGDPYWDLFQRFNQNRSSGNTEGILVLQEEYGVPGGKSPLTGLDGFYYERAYGPIYWLMKDPDGLSAMLFAQSQQGGRPASYLRPTTHFTHTIWENGQWDKDLRNNERNIRRDWQVTNPASAWLGRWYSEFPQSWYDGLSAQDTLRDFYPQVMKITTPGDHPTSDLMEGFTDGSMSNTARLTRTDWYLVRVAETYLLRAEAHLAAGEPGAAATDINVLRSRADADPVLLEDVDIDYILDERMRELNYEENRRLTLSRLNLLYDRTVKYNEFSGATIQTFNNLMPIPFSEIERNTEAVIEQNSGYTN